MIKWKKWCSLSLLAVTSLIIAACGGGGGASAGSGTSDGTAATVQAPVVGGNYSGTYHTNAISSTPYSMWISQADSILTGDFTSTKISGKVTGTVSADKIMTLTVTEPRSLGSIQITLTPSGTGYVVSSISGTDVFGMHTSGSGTVAAAAAPASEFANGYNGTATFLNGTATSAVPVTTSGGTYPISITNILPDGNGGYSGVIVSKIVAGMLGITYVPVASQYVGTVYTGPSSLKFIMGNGGFTLADMLSNQTLYRQESNTSAVYLYTTSMALHPGDFGKVFPGVTWSYTNPDQTAVGILSMKLNVAPSNGINYSAAVTSSIRYTAGGPVDTVSGNVSGTYDLNQAVNPRAPGRVFQLVLTPSAPLVIANNSGLTANMNIYVAWVDNGSSTRQALMTVDTGTKALPDVILTSTSSVLGVLVDAIKTAL